MQGDNPYDDIIREMEGGDAATTVALQRGRNPADVARARRLSRYMSTPAPVIEREINVYAADQRRQEAAEAIRSDPRLAGYLLNPENAALAQNDTPRMARMGALLSAGLSGDERDRPQQLDAIFGGENRGPDFRSPAAMRVSELAQRGVEDAPVNWSLARGIRGAGGMFAEAGLRIAQGGVGIVRMVSEGGDRLGIPGARGETSDRLIAGAAAGIEQGIEAVRPELAFGWQRSIYSGLISTTQTAAFLPAGGGAVLAGLTGVTTGEAYGRYRGRGASVEEAATGALAEGGIEYLTERLPIGFLFNNFGRTGARRFIGGFAVREFGSEQVATHLQDAVDASIANPNMTWEQYWADRPQAALDTAVATGVMVLTLGGSGAIASRLQPQAREAEQIVVAQDGQATLDGLMREAEQSEVRRLDPQSLAEFVNERAEGTPAENIYIPVEAIDTYFQSESAEPDFFEPYAAQIEEARRVGGDVVVPIGDAMARLAGTPAWEALREDVRLTPGGMSGREARERGAVFLQELEDRGAEIAAEAVAAQEALTPVIEVYQRTRDQLLGIGRTEAEASAAAQIVAARSEAAGARVGQNALEYREARPIEFRRAAKGEGPARGALQQTIRAGDLAPFTVHQGNEGGAIETDPAREAINQELRRSVAAEGVRGPAEGEDPIVLRVDTDRGLAWLHNGNHRTVIANEINPDMQVPVRIEYVSGLKRAYAAAQPYEGQFDRTALQQGDKRTVRGQAQFYADNPGAIVTLFAEANRSTLIHELGHVFLQEMVDDAAGADAPQELKDDVARIEKWFAANKHPVTGGKIPVEAHELFARGFERYLLEGKAPSASLRGVFAQFARWLGKIYKSVLSLRSPITPEIREVFDRMLATEEAIAAQNAVGHFVSAEVAQMTEAEFEAYTASLGEARGAAFDALLAKTMEGLRRRETARLREQRKNVRAQVEAEINARLEFQALHLLRTGKWLGQPGREGVDLKINNAWLMDNYGEDAVDRMPKGLPITRADGQDGDVIAEILGMASGDQLVRTMFAMREAADALRAAGDMRSPRVAMIETEVERILAERHGDVMTEEDLREEALAAVNNAREGEVIAGEVRQLARRKPGMTATPYRIAREWARRTVLEGRVRDVASRAAMQRHARAAQRAAAAYEKAILEDNVDEAFRQKQAQLLNHALLAESKIAADRVDAIVARMSRIGGQKARKSVDQDYFDRIHELLERYDFRPRSRAAIAEGDRFEAWAARRRAEGFEVHVPPRLDRAEHYSRIQVEHLYELEDTIGSLLHLGKRKQTYKDHQGEIEFNALRDEALANMRSAKDIKLPKDPSEKEQAAGRLIPKAVAGLVKVEFLADRLDADKIDGPFNRVLIEGAKASLNAYHELTDSVLKPLAELYLSRTRKQRARLEQKVTSDRLVWSSRAFKDGADNPLAGKPVTLTRAGWLAVALNTGNLSNLEKMTKGEGWNVVVVQEEVGRILNKEEWDFVDAIWRRMDELWPRIAENERELSGVVPEQVEALDVETPYGTYKGGYWPAVRDVLRSQRAENDAAAAADDLFAYHSGIGTAKGHTITRTGAVYPMSYRLEEILLGHIDQAVTRIAYQSWVRDAVRFIDNSAISGTIDTKVGREYREQIKPWIKRQINSHAIDQRGGAWWNSLLRRFRVNLSISAMGFAYSTGAAQTLGLYYSIGRLGSTGTKTGFGTGLQYMAIGLRRMLNIRSGAGVAVGAGAGTALMGPLGTAVGGTMGYLLSGAGGAFREATDFVFSRSPEMLRRNQAVSREVVEAFTQIRGRTSLLAHAKAMFFWHIGMIDRYMVALPTWLGAHQKALDEGMTDAAASAYADKMVRTSQGSGAEKDLAAVQSPNSEAARFFTMFYTPFNVLFNAQWESARKARNGQLEAAMVQTTMFLLLTTLADALMSGDWPEDEESDGFDVMDLAGWFTRNVAFGLFAGVPVARDVANVAERNIRGEYANLESPVSQTFETVGKAIDRTFALSEDAPYIELEDNEANGAYIRGVANAIGLSFGLPGGQVGKTGGFLWDVQSGEADPDSVRDWYAGLTSGRLPEEGR